MNLFKILCVFSLYFCIIAKVISSEMCSSQDTKFIEDTVSSENFESKLIDKISKFNPEHFCIFQNKIMLDGISYSFYKFNEASNYIRINNGLDGSTRLYGPFNSKHITKK